MMIRMPDFTFDNWNWNQNYAYSSNTHYPVYDISIGSGLPPKQQTPMEWLRSQVEDICALARTL